jgi:hypothetical protein
VLARDGKGSLYYRIGMKYAPDDLQLSPLENGFVVQRKYEAVDNPGDVSRDSSGAWHVRPGARVRIRLSLVAPSRRYHVALVDPIPAGFEILNPELAVTENLPDDMDEEERDWGGEDAAWWRWLWSWYDHENLRDDRVEVCTPLLWADVYTYTYYARATTPGTFVVPPARAEEMYAPETFGRTGSDKVVIR